MSHRAGFYDDDAGANKANGGQQQAKQAAGKAASKDKTLPTGGKGNEQSGGWFGGIWGKLSLKPKNQMILPDDKNPSVSWRFVCCKTSSWIDFIFCSSDCLGSGQQTVDQHGRRRSGE